MNVWISASILTFVLAVPLFLALRLLLFRADLNFSAEWLDAFSIDNYRPMQRLLNESDYDFLASQPGFNANIASELRAERKRIFRAYLRQLNSDFQRLVYIGNLMVVQSSVDRSDLASAISQARVRFFWSCLQAEMSLALDPLPLGKINPANLIDSLALVLSSIEQASPEQLA